MTPRENATEELLYFIDRFVPGSDNRKIYANRLAAMSNKQFDAFMESLASGEEVLALWVANLDQEHKLSIERNHAIARELDYSFYHHLIMTDQDTGQRIRTPIPHMVIDLPLRRQAQMLYKKANIPDHNQSVDERTGQASNDSKGASISYPELQVNAAKGLDKMVLELIKVRGGDVDAFNAANRSIMETGGVSQDAIFSKLPSTVKANDTLAVYLKAMMLEVNL